MGVRRRLPEDATLHVAIVENSPLIRGFLARAVLGSLRCTVSEYPTTTDFLKEAQRETVVIISFAGRADKSLQDIELIAAARPESRAIVFAQAGGPETALLAIGHGAKGYVPVTIGWTLAVAAIRIVAAGGTYIPAEYVIVQPPSLLAVSHTVTANGITVREMAVLREIQQGKANKIIAHELNVSESTVKAHIRHIMYKFRARNRTELAVRSTEILIGRDA